MEAVIVLAVIAIFAFVIATGLQMGRSDCDSEHEDFDILLQMHEEYADGLNEKVDALYKHLGLQVKTVPEHKEVVKYEPLSSLSGLTIASLGMNNVRLSGSNTLGSLISNDKPAPKSTKKRG